MAIIISVISSCWTHISDAAVMVQASVYIFASVKQSSNDIVHVYQLFNQLAKFLKSYGWILWNFQKECATEQETVKCFSIDGHKIRSSARKFLLPRIELRLFKWQCLQVLADWQERENCDDLQTWYQGMLKFFSIFLDSGGYAEPALRFVKRGSCPSKIRCVPLTLHQNCDYENICHLFSCFILQQLFSPGQIHGSRCQHQTSSETSNICVRKQHCWLSCLAYRIALSFTYRSVILKYATEWSLHHFKKNGAFWYARIHCCSAAVCHRWSCLSILLTSWTQVVTAELS